MHFTFEGSDESLQAIAQAPMALRLTDFPRTSTGAAMQSGWDLAPVTRLRCLLHAPGPVGLGGALPQSREVAWEGSEQSGVVTARHAEAHWERGADGLRAEARLSAATPRAAESLLTALGAALLHRAGGAILHSASVELPEGVVAFVGPSGAGKSTACEHVVGGRHFSLDRLAVAPEADARSTRRWVAHPLPGGTPSDKSLPPSVALGRPLLAVLEIHKAPDGCELKMCSKSRAVALLRASAFHANRRRDVEIELLCHLERLAREVPVAELHLSLGTSLEPILSRWLASV